MSETTLPPIGWAQGVPTRGRRRYVPAAWPIVFIFCLLPVWWLMGVSGFIVPAMGVVLLVAVLFGRRVGVPRGFGLYLLFLVWCAFSATRVDDARQAFSLGYRGAIYVASGALFLYVLNHDHDELPAEAVFKAFAVFFAIAVVGGVIGMLLPNTTITTPVQSLLPRNLLDNQFISDLVTASTSSGRAFAAYPIYRPKAPFIYSNEWGAAFAMSLPFAVGSLRVIRHRLWRDAMLLLLFASVFPFVFSLNRGAWLSAGAGMLYAAIRLARGRSAQLVKALAVGSLVVGALLFVTPLGEIIQARLANGYGDAHRQQLYAESLELVKASPVLGYGAPVLVEGNLSAGTHGQLWTVLVSQGIPGVVFFLGWLAWCLWKASRPLPPGHPGDRTIRFWSEVAIFIALIQTPFYDLLPWGLPIAMAAAALAWRERIAPAAASATA